MKKLFLFLLMFSFSLSVSAQSDRFLLLEDENSKCFLDTITYTVKRDSEGKIDKIYCDILVLYNSEGSKKFCLDNASFISSLSPDASSKNFDTINITYELSLKNTEQTKIHEIEFLAAGKTVLKSQLTSSDEELMTLQGVDIEQILNRTNFYIQAQSTPPNNKRLLFLEENAYSGKYLDIDSFKVARLISNNRQTILIDLFIIEVPTKLGISDFVAQNTLNGKYQPYQEELSYYKYNYLINPIENNFLLGNCLYYYKDGTIESQKAKTDWQSLDEQPFGNGMSAKTALIYAIAYDPSLKDIQLDISEPTTPVSEDTL